MAPLGAAGLLATALAAAALMALPAPTATAFTRSAEAARAHATLASLAGKRARTQQLRADVQAGAYPPVTVQTAYGSLTGFQSGNVSMFLGVPFAAPPVGALRWRPPQPPAPWGSRNATWYGDSCMQSAGPFTEIVPTAISEDCLYLSVAAPAGPPPPGGWPLMLYWYGGSYVQGSESFLIYNPYNVVALTQDVVVASVSYRLGGFGFLAGDALRNESADGSVGTLGLKDQRAGLQFMLDNAAAFGVDASRVTIFGESAGAGSVTAHLLAPASRGLFQRAIMESGPAAVWTAMPYNISGPRLDALAAATNCSSASGPVMLACLRALDAATIESALNDVVSDSTLLSWAPTIDGVEVLGDPRVIAAAGGFPSNVSVMLGSNQDEGTDFVPAPTSLNASAYEAAVATFLGPSLAAGAVQRYPPAAYASPWLAFAAIIGDVVMSCPVRQTARWLTGAAGNARVHVYFYTHVFAFVAQVLDPLTGVPRGAFHGSELVNVYDWEVVMYGPGEVDLARQFVRYWTRFAATGDPNGGGDPAWPAYGNATIDLVAELNTTTTGAPGANVTALTGLKAANCDFWDANPIPYDIFWIGPDAAW